jgi:PAS domain S-box-containing protein
LYVEDNAEDADLMRRELARSAPWVKLTLAKSLAEAKSRLSESGSNYDAALIDLGLPDGSGFFVIQEIRARALAIPSIVLSGLATPETAQSALEAGADDFVVKSNDHLARIPAALDAAILRFQAEAIVATQGMRLLYVADGGAEVELTLRHLRRHAPQIAVEVVRTHAEMLERLPRTATEPCSYDVALLDQRAVRAEALELLKTLRDERGLDLPVVMLAGPVGGRLAAQVYRFGATDYFVKHPGYLFALPAVLRAAHDRVEVTRQRHALGLRELALQRSTDRFRSLFESLPDAVILVHAQGVIMTANSQTTALFGYSQQELIGMPVEMLMPEAARGPHVGLRSRFLTSAMPRPMGATGRPLVAMKKDGSVFPVDICLSPLPSNEGMQVVAAIRDMSAHVRAEQARERLEAQLRQAQKLEAIGTLASGIAHDFNNLLTILAMSAEAMDRGLEIDHPTRVDLEPMNIAIGRAAELVRGILAFTRESPVRLEPLAVVPLVEETARLMRAMLPPSVTLRTVIGARDPAVRADATQLHQVLVNLCTNAWHALDGRPGQLVIGVEDLAFTEPTLREGKSIPAGNYVHLYVRDTGAGMDEATRARIFDPFFTTKPVGQGTGLGLSVVHGIVGNHAGFISVETTLGHGTTFHLYLPALDRVDNAAQSVRAPVASVRGRPMRVLLVDDETLLLRSAQRFLERRSHSVTGCSQASEALEHYRANPRGFDLVVSDFNMPDVSGLDLAEELTRLGSQIPFVIISGHIPPGMRERAAQVGVMHTLQKPFSLDDLLKLVDQVSENQK